MEKSLKIQDLALIPFDKQQIIKLSNIEDMNLNTLKKYIYLSVKSNQPIVIQDTTYKEQNHCNIKKKLAQNKFYQLQPNYIEQTDNIKDDNFIIIKNSKKYKFNQKYEEINLKFNEYLNKKYIKPHVIEQLTDNLLSPDKVLINNTITRFNKIMTSLSGKDTRKQPTAITYNTKFEIFRKLKQFDLIQDLANIVGPMEGYSDPMDIIGPMFYASPFHNENGEAMSLNFLYYGIKLWLFLNHKQYQRLLYELPAFMNKRYKNTSEECHINPGCDELLGPSKTIMFSFTGNDAFNSSLTYLYIG